MAKSFQLLNLMGDAFQGIKLTLVLVIGVLVPPPLLGADAEWNTNGNGDWTTGGNWNPASAPGGAGDVATFGNIITADRTVNLDADTTVGGLIFNDDDNYLISGANTLTFDNSGSTATLTVNNSNGDGAHEISTAIQLDDDIEITQLSTGEFQLSGVISGTGGLTTNGDQKVTLHGTNTFSGDVAVENGIVQVSDIVSDGDSNLGAGATAVGLGSATTYGTLYYNGADGVSFTRGLDVKAGGGKFYTSRDVTFNTGGIAIASGGTLDIETFDSSDDITFNSVISGNGDLTFSGSGHYKLNGANTYTGGTTLTNGDLRIGNNSALGTGTLHVDGGVIYFDGASRTLSNDLDIAGDITFAFSDGNNGTFTGNNYFTEDASTHTINNDNAFRYVYLTGGTSGDFGLRLIGGNNANFYFGGDKDITQGFTLDANTRLILRDAATTFGSGGFTMNNGILYFGHNSALGDSDLTINGGSIAADAADRTIANDVYMNTHLLVVGGISTGRNLYLSGNVYFNEDGSTYTINNAVGFRSVSFSQGLTGAGGAAGNFGLSVTGDSSAYVYFNGDNHFTGGLTLGTTTLYLSHANTDIGDLTVNSGKLYVNAAGALPTDTDVTVAGGAIYLENVSQTIDELDGSGTIYFGSGSTNTLTIGNDDGSSTFSGVLAQDGNITKAGSGTVVFSGVSANSYTGVTTINAGILALDKNASGTNAIAGSGIVVNSGGTLELREDNQIGNTTSLTLAGGTFDTQGYSDTLGNLTLTENSVIDLGGIAGGITFADVNNGSWDPTKTLNINNWVGVLSQSPTPSSDTNYIRFVSDPRLSANLMTALTNGNIIFNSSYEAWVTEDAGYFYLHAAPVVPEASTYASAAALLSLAGLHYYRRRKQKA